jgi:rhodanese-related sulfurtransferase
MPHQMSARESYRMRLALIGWSGLPGEAPGRRFVLRLSAGVTAVLLLAGLASGRGDSPAEALSLVRACAKSQSCLDHFSSRITTVDDGKYFDAAPRREECHALVRRDGDRLDVSEQSAVSSEKSKAKTEPQRARLVIAKDLCVLSSCPVSKPTPPAAGSASKDTAIMFAVRGLNRYHGGPLDGYFPPTGNRRVAEIMAESPNLRLLKEERVAGVPCKVVEAATPHGTYTVWLDRARGSLPCKVQYRVDGGDFHEYWDPIRFSQKMMPTPDGEKHPGTEETGILEDIVYERTGDAFVPMAGKFTRVDAYGDARLSDVFTYQRSEFQLNPNFEGTDAFVSELREGARISYASDQRSGVKYEWRGGKVVIGGTDKGGETPVYYSAQGPTTLQHGAMALGGALLFAVGAFLTLRARVQPTAALVAPPGVSVAIALLLCLTLNTASAYADGPPKKKPSQRPDTSYEPYCGVQCLYRAMRALGKDVTFDRLVQPEYISSKQGSSIADLQLAAEENGVHLLPLTRMSCLMLREIHCPVILHVKPTPEASAYKHWVLFMGDKDGIAWIYDGDQPAKEISEEDLAARWDGTGIVVSNEPVSALGLSTEMLYPYVFYGGLCALGIGVLSLVSRRWERPLDRGRMAAFRNALAQAACLALVALGLCMGYRFVNGTGYLSNSHTVAVIQESHLGTFLPKINAGEVADLLGAPGVTVVDARRSGDYQLGHLPGAISVPVDGSDDQCEQALDGVAKTSKIVVYAQTKYCSFGYTVAKRLMEHGYGNIIVFRDGYHGWTTREAEQN